MSRDSARNCIAALQKRLTHRSANVQLFSLTVGALHYQQCVRRQLTLTGFTFTSSPEHSSRIADRHSTAKSAAKRSPQL